MKSSPYQGLPPSRFWKSAVTKRGAEQEIHAPKFPITLETKVATAGSCFAQHIHRQLKSRDLAVLDVEPPPLGLSEENRPRYGFGMFSARYGNIYHVRQLLQLAREALEGFQPADAVWERDARYFDALRPGVEPDGFATAEEVTLNRAAHLAQVRTLFREADVFVFTLGLTEAWVHTESGTVYPTAPGAIAGTYDPARHSFRNFSYDEVCDDFLAFRKLMHGANPAMKFLITVSPVPLTATASDQHVLVATMHSKAILRAAAGRLAAENEDIDYFPSFELVANPWVPVHNFGDNLRNVRDEAVARVMQRFCEIYGLPAPQRRAGKRKDGDTPCEEAMLEAFAR